MEKYYYFFGNDLRLYICICKFENGLGTNLIGSIISWLWGDRWLNIRHRNRFTAALFIPDERACINYLFSLIKFRRYPAYSRWKNIYRLRTEKYSFFCVFVIRQTWAKYNLIFLRGEWFSKIDENHDRQIINGELKESWG